jgi:hypothetical protein
LLRICQVSEKNNKKTNHKNGNLKI